MAERNRIRLSRFIWGAVVSYNTHNTTKKSVLHRLEKAQLRLHVTKIRQTLYLWQQYAQDNTHRFVRLALLEKCFFQNELTRRFAIQGDSIARWNTHTKNQRRRRLILKRACETRKFLLLMLCAKEWQFEMRSTRKLIKASNFLKFLNSKLLMLCFGVWLFETRSGRKLRSLLRCWHMISLDGAFCQLQTHAETQKKRFRKFSKVSF